MRAEIAFKMCVVSPSETVWSSSYELFCVGSKKYLTWRVILTCFVSSMGPFWKGFGVILRYTNSSTKMSTKIIQTLFDFASKMVPIDLQIAFGVQFGLGNAFSAAFHSKTPPILEPKFNQNQSGSNQKSKKSIIEVDVIF